MNWIEATLIKIAEWISESITSMETDIVNYKIKATGPRFFDSPRKNMKYTGEHEHVDGEPDGWLCDICG